jgi:hypothetical protein
MAESFDGSGNEWRADQEGSVPSAWVWSQYKGEFPQTMTGREGSFPDGGVSCDAIRRENNGVERQN